MARPDDVVSAIVRFNRGRDPERLALKYRAMAKDALAFFRGTCHLYCDDWPATGRLGETPAVWVCGDLHIENFGSYKGDNRLPYFDIADFDEALLAPCAFDLSRLATSAFLAARIHDLKRKHAAALCRTFLTAYGAAIRYGKARWIERATAEGLLRSLFRRVENRRRSAFLAQRTERRGDRIALRVDGKRALPIADEDRKRVKKFMRAFAADKPQPEFFKVLDVARRIAGTGALGLERYVVLIEGRGGRAGQFLLDLKRATPSALARCIALEQPRWKTEAERVVSLERRMQAVTPALLQAVMLDSRPFVLRELMPTQDKLDLGQWKGSLEYLELLARDLGSLVAWSELRSGGRQGSATTDELIAFAERRKWQRAVLEYAEHYQEVAWRDWQVFRDALRAGRLAAAPH